MARAQGSQASAKEDTVYLSLASTPETDLSQHLTNLTVSGAGAYELNSTRVQLTAVRTVSIRWLATKTEGNALLMIHGDNAQTDYTWGFATTPGGSLCAHQNGGTIWTAAATTDAKEYTVSWAMRDNPDTTGAADAKISELIVYNHTDTVVTEQTHVTHAAPTSSASWTLSVGGWWDGATLTSPPVNTPIKARVSSSYHPDVEVFEDWIGARTAYAGDADDGIDEPVGPIPVSSTMGDAGRFAGRHPWGYGAAHSKAVQRRAWSPLVNKAWSDAQVMTATPSPVHWAAAAPGSASYSMLINTLRWVPIPAQATHAWVRVHVLSYVTAGAAVPLGIRCYAMNRLPSQATIGAEPAPALEVFYTGEELTVDHGASGTGEWMDLGYVRLPRFAVPITGWEGTAHLALAYAVDPGSVSANDANARVVLGAWGVRPAYRLTVGVLDL